MAQPPEDESFLARWSKRKRLAEEEPAPELPPEEPLPPEESDSISEEDLAALPSLEEFTPQTDIRPFLKKGVPQALRNAALRKIWLLTPAIRDHKDPAVDYAWDWNTPGGVPGDGAAPTAERAAQMLRDLLHPRRDAAPQEGPETNDASPENMSEERLDSAPQQGAESGVVPPDKRGLDPVDPPNTASRKSEEKQSATDLPAARRRHGGALPD